MVSLSSHFIQSPLLTTFFLLTFHVLFCSPLHPLFILLFHPFFTPPPFHPSSPCHESLLPSSSCPFTSTLYPIPTPSLSSFHLPSHLLHTIIISLFLLHPLYDCRSSNSILTYIFKSRFHLSSSSYLFTTLFITLFVMFFC